MGDSRARLVLAALLALSACFTVSAQSSSQFQLSRNEIGALDGSAVLVSSGYRLSVTTLSDSVAALSAQSPGYRLSTDWTATFPPAVEVVHLRFSAQDTLTWSLDPSLGTYRVYRGNLESLPTPSASCVGRTSFFTQFVDATTPSLGQPFYFLVTAVDASGVEATAGKSSAGVERTVAGSCPSTSPRDSAGEPWETPMKTQPGNPVRHVLARFTLVAAATLLIPEAVTSAATPDGRVNYQGVLRDSAGLPVDGARDMVFRIWDAPAGSNEVLVDSHLAAGTGAVMVSLGLFSTAIGGGAVTDGSGPGTYTELRAVFADFSELYLEVTIAGETLTPRIRIGSAAFALNSASVEGRNVSGIEADAQARVDTHGNVADIHQPRYTDSEAVAAVAASSLVPSGSCTGANEVLRWNGSTWSCETIQVGGGAGPSGGNAVGFEVADMWNLTWDGLPRISVPHSNARLSCSSAGARLPTVTELWRVHTSGGFQPITTGVEDRSFWADTALPRDSNFYVHVNLDTGVVGGAASSDRFPFRCVWDESGGEFDDDQCFTEFGRSCREDGLWHNTDQVARLFNPLTGSADTLNFGTAIQECLADGANVLDLRAASRRAREEGFAGTTTVWTPHPLGDLGQGSNEYAVARLRNVADSLWNWSDADAGSNLDIDNRFFWCIGRRPGTPDFPVSNPPCQGACTQPDRGAGSLLVDSQSRAAATHAAAAESCRLDGGRLPRAGEVLRIMYGGLPNGTGLPHWTNEPVLATGFELHTYSWSGTSGEHWFPLPNVGSSTPSTLHEYRCVWPSAVEASPTVCAADEIQNWDGTSFSCAPSVDGNSGGQAVPAQFVDAWGNAWDAGLQRGGTYPSAVATCNSLGGRLPTLGEVWRVRNGNGVAPAIGDASETAFAWTTGEITPSSNMTIRVSDGTTAVDDFNNELLYRCIWPASKGNSFAGRSCDSDPTQSCFQTGFLRVDSFDRPPAPYKVAVEECEMLGGQLPLFDELSEAIRAGLPNGTGRALWLEQPAISGPSEGLATIGWSGTGTPAWDLTDPTTTTIVSPDPVFGAMLPYRCVFSSRHDY